MTIEELINEELRLEQESVQIGVDRYRTKLHEAISKKQDLTRLTPEHDLMRRVLQPLSEWIHKAKKAKGSTQHGKIIPYIKLADNNTLAFITARFCINLLSCKNSLQNSAIKLADEVKFHLEFVELSKAKPGLVKAYDKAFSKRATSVHVRKRATKAAIERAAIPVYEWESDIKLQIGSLLISGFIETSGFLKIIEQPHKKGKIKVLVATPAVVDWLQDAHNKCELLSPLNLPMVAPPRPWTSLFGGGYLSARGGRVLKLVRTRSKEAVKVLDKADLSKVFKAVNALQDTPWHINPFIHQVLKDIWDMGGDIAGVPPLETDINLPPKAWSNDDEYQAYKEEHPEEFLDWKHKTAKAWEEWHSTTSKRAAVRFKLYVADKFQDYERIYMPWTLDWRGRMYPVPQYVNPQGDDLGKALLEFAEGKRLGERGVYWLAIHGANCFGVDKVSFQERVKWVKDHEAEIQDSATNPLDGYRFWVDADDPFKFLAFCKEWLGVLEQGEDFESRIPVALDGSSNGLQHFSALLRDERGGQAVCLVPADKPSDIYQEVADVANAIIEEDCKEGNELAQVWRGKITRKLTKRNTMTTPYGVSSYGRVEQLIEELKKAKSPILAGIDSRLYFPACRYLAEVNGRAIEQVVTASKLVMDWLQSIARIAEGPITWTTPSGFKPLQQYKKTDTLRVRTYWGKSKIDLTLAKDSDKEDVSSEVNGMSPNFIHSLDAAHCALTINSCVDVGLSNFSMIHDSYATYACDTDTLARILREEFVKLHSKPLLELFREEVMEQIGKDLPPVPKLENPSLELEKVKESLYFFS